VPVRHRDTAVETLRDMLGLVGLEWMSYRAATRRAQLTFLEDNHRLPSCGF